VPNTGTILDLLESGITSAMSTRRRSILPRSTDAVSDALELASDLKEGEDIEALVIEVKDAYWLIPLLRTERRCNVARYRGRYVLFKRIAQGSSGALLRSPASRRS